MIRTDLFETATSILGNTRLVLLILGGVIGLLIVIIIAWKAKGALSAIVSAAVVGILFVWVLNNIDNDDIQSQLTDTVIPDGHGPIDRSDGDPVAAPVGSLQGV